MCQIALTQYDPIMPYGVGGLVFVNIGSGIGLMPNLYQGIPWTNTDLSSVRSRGTNLNQNAKIFIKGNTFQNIVCKMGAIVSGFNMAKKRKYFLI